MTPTHPLSVRAAAREAPDALALWWFGECHAESRKLTWAELSSEAERAITWLCAHEFDGPSNLPRALIATSSIESVAMILALLELGLPALLLHPRAPEAERARLLEELGPATLVPNVVPKTRAADARPSYAVDEAWPAAIFTTSGSTGSPKGVLLSRRALVASAQAASARLMFGAAEDRWCCPLPLAHVGGLSVLVRALVARRGMVLVEPSSPERLWAALCDAGATHASLVPTMLRRMLDARLECPENLRALMLGGAGAGPGLRVEARARGWPIRTTYGLTEAAGPVTLESQYPPLREDGSGAPLGDTQVRIREGRIEVRGPTLLSGYVPPGIHPSPLTEDGWLMTHDLGRLEEDGTLCVLGRVAELIVTGGENVLAAEVEAVLSRLPGVTEAFVFGRVDREWGELVAAALVLEPGARLPELNEVRSAVRSQLAAFKLPRALCELSSLPLLPSGKLDRRAARAMAEAALLKSSGESE